MPRLARRLAGFLAFVLVALLAIGAWAYLQLRASLPQLDGERAVAGASSTIKVERDALGIPTITAVSRVEVARGLGFVHAQDRFFQMDLARRRAAGELSELLGSAAVQIDTRTRMLRFRARARRAIEQSTPAELAVLSAYAEGVNAGLAALDAKPPEYWVLRAEPRPWALEDSALVLASMFLILQDSEGRRESRVGAVYASLPAPVADFITTSSSDWETPLAGDVQRVPPIPDAGVFDARTAPPALPPSHSGAQPDPDSTLIASMFVPSSDDARGSNSWALGGHTTASGSAIVANDMHLNLTTPNIWYRASMVWSDTRRHELNGITLAGLPLLVAGSNGDVAWAFTNSTGDWSDLVIVEPDPADATRYRTASGAQPFAISRETIAVKGGVDVPVEVRDTVWGPLIGRDANGRERAIAWVPLRDGGLNFTMGGFETAETLEQLFDVAASAGIPAQNLVAGQRDGRIGWTIAGRIPRRIGYDGRLPASWADGARAWDGWLSASEYPRIIDPPDGRLVTANNRLVNGAGLLSLGDGGYDAGARARQIKDDLAAIERASVRDMMTVQLDDRAIFLVRWRDLLLKTLSNRDVENSESRRELRRVVTDNWTGKASSDSAAYRLVREFRTNVGELALAPLIERVRVIEPDYAPVSPRTGEGPLWALVTERPAHLLDRKFATWSDLMLAAADRTAENAQAAGGIASYTWGHANTVRIRHPFSIVMPVLGRFLDMTPIELPGDSNMPRVQAPSFGASERFAVSPGREREGYFHMPTGQSGHFLSPHYRDAQSAWANGEATPFLPGATVHTLSLRPDPPSARQGG